MKSTPSDNFSAGGFNAIPGATGLSYDPGPIDVTTFYARCVRIKGCTDYLEANIVKVEVKDDAKAEIIADAITCYLSRATFEVVTTTSNPQVQWDFPAGMNPSSTTGKEVSASFNSFGYYTVGVTVTENGCSTSSSIRVLATYTSTYCDEINFVIEAGALLEEENVIRLDWKVLNDGLDYSFDIEHSGTGTTYAKIAEVKNPVEVKDGYKHYQYVDAQPKKGRNLYRVQMKDNNGGASLSNVLDLMLFEPGTEVMIYPNPVQDRLMVEFAKEHDQEIQIELVSAEGSVLRTVTWDAKTIQKDMDFSAYPSGLYFVRIKIGTETTEVMKVLKRE
jgi:PKD repeat protein